MEIKLEKEISYHKDGILSCDIKNSILATGSEDDTVVLWQLPSLAPIRQAKIHENNVKKVLLLKDGQEILTASGDGELKISSVSDLSPKEVFSGHDSGINEVCFLSENEFITVSDDATARLWKIGSKKFIKAIKPGIGDIKACAVSADKIAIGGSCLVFLDSNLSTLKKHDEYIYGINKIKVNSGLAFISASMEKTLEIWDISKMSILKKIRNSSWINDICFCKGKTILAMGESIKVLSENFETESEFEAHSDEIYSLAVYEDFLVSGANDKLLKIWKIN